MQKQNCSFSDIIILAGGIGERLWPASTPENPKQFMRLQDGRSFLQLAIIRSLALNPIGKIVIVTKKNLLEKTAQDVYALGQTLSEKEKTQILKQTVIIAEPCARHTCAPLFLVCKYLEHTAQNIEHTILTLASDHIISPIENFVFDSEKAFSAAKEGNFVCYAIPPTFPATGYGYIKQGENLSTFSDIFKIAHFKEKPNLETAKEYLLSGKYFWNSGMFAFTSEFFQNEVKICSGDVYSAFEKQKISTPKEEIISGVSCIASWDYMEKVYENVPQVAVDTAVAEKTKHAVAVKASFNWDDVGSWDSFSQLFEKNQGISVEIDGANNFIYSDIPTAVCGLDDVIVVIKNGMALVMKKGESDKMRAVVKQIKDYTNERRS